MKNNQFKTSLLDKFNGSTIKNKGNLSDRQNKKWFIDLKYSLPKSENKTKNFQSNIMIQNKKRSSKKINFINQNLSLDHNNSSNDLFKDSILSK